MIERVILVDEQDQPLGTMEKMEAHEKGLLHRAFSVFVFNSSNELMLHRRALTKYHSGGLWTNTCCSHPREGEETIDAAHRRLQEEMGFDCDLQEAFHFLYKAELDNDLTEHELDHVFIGRFDGEVNLNPEEVDSFKHISMDELEGDVKAHPEKYTEWFKICLEEVLEKKELVLSKL
jgi:isopentenyl-diphosphate delta-isomerase